VNVGVAGWANTAVAADPRNATEQKRNFIIKSPKSNLFRADRGTRKVANGLDSVYWAPECCSGCAVLEGSCNHRARLAGFFQCRA
jgi:hypothetical protein